MDLAPGAEHDPLARHFVDAMRRALQDEGRRRVFRRLRGAVGVVADDAATALTLRFDFGRLTVHEGLVGVPTITIRGPSGDIRELSSIPFTRLGAIDLRRLGALAAVRRVAGALGKRRLKVYGMLTHPRLVVSLLRLLSAPEG